MDECVNDGGLVGEDVVQRDKLMGWEGAGPGTDG
jgi:hypothetical protein